jgi:hypothetical protein
MIVYQIPIFISTWTKFFKLFNLVTWKKKCFSCFFKSSKYIKYEEETYWWGLMCYPIWRKLVYGKSRLKWLIWNKWTEEWNSLKSNMEIRQSRRRQEEIERKWLKNWSWKRKEKIFKNKKVVFFCFKRDCVHWAIKKIRNYQLSSSTRDDADEWVVRDFGPIFILAEAPSIIGDSVLPPPLLMGAVTTYCRRSDDSPIFILSNFWPTFLPHVEIPANKIEILNKNCRKYYSS